MCAWIVKVQGLKVCGRSVYRTDTGIKVGYQGPTVSLQEACEDLSDFKAGALTTACANIDRVMAERQAGEDRWRDEQDRLAEEQYQQDAVLGNQVTDNPIQAEAGL